MQRFYAGEFQQIADDEIGLICGSDGVKRDGNDFVMRGIDTSAFMQNPVFQCEHTPPPIGVFTRLAVVSARDVGLGIPGDALAGVVRLAPADISPYVAEKRGLIKAGYYNAVSIGIDPDPEAIEPIDPRDPRGGRRVLRSELLEVSAVSTPADPTALIVARSFKSRSRETTAFLRSLPAITQPAIDRALGKICRRQEVPVGLLSAQQQWERDRQRTMAAWAIGEARREEERLSFDERRREVARLGKIEH